MIVIRFYPVFIIGIGLLGAWYLWAHGHHLGMLACGWLVGLGWAMLDEQGGIRSLFR